MASYEEPSIVMFPPIKEEVKEDAQGEENGYDEGLCELPLQVVLTHVSEDEVKDEVVMESEHPSHVVIPRADKNMEEGPLRERIVCEEVVVKSASVTVKRHIRVTTQDRAAQTDFWPLVTPGIPPLGTSSSAHLSTADSTKQQPIATNSVTPASPAPVSSTVPGGSKKDCTDCPQTSRRFRCRCGKAFARSDHLKQHAQTHAERKQYVCNLCNKAFCRSDILNAHLRWHWGDTPYSCEVCGAVFVQASRLSRHRLIHLVHKPFPCDVCGMSFARADNLASHVRTHTGEKPFPCPDCGSAFRRADALQRHRRTHTGERPYGCRSCGRAFAAARALRRHERMHIPPDTSNTSPGFPYPSNQRNTSNGEAGNEQPDTQSDPQANSASSDANSTNSEEQSVEDSNAYSNNSNVDFHSSDTYSDSMACGPSQTDNDLYSATPQPFSMVHPSSASPHANSNSGSPHSYITIS